MAAGNCINAAASKLKKAFLWVFVDILLVDPLYDEGNKLSPIFTACFHCEIGKIKQAPLIFFHINTVQIPAAYHYNSPHTCLSDKAKTFNRPLVILSR